MSLTKRWSQLRQLSRIVLFLPSVGHDSRHLPPWLTFDVRQKKQTMSPKRVIITSCIGGLVVLLFATSVAPYYIRQHYLRSQFQRLSESDATEFISETQAIMARHLTDSKETFEIRINEANLNDLPEKIRALKPGVVMGGRDAINVLCGGFGDSVTAVNIYRKDQQWYIFGYFGHYSNPPIQAYPRKQN
jgi:hypothetical protein